MLYELDGANRFRVIAYKEAARVIRQSPVSVGELAVAGKATDLPGIGDTLQEKIVALVETGEIPAAAKLKAKFPASLIEVTRIPGLGAKTVRKLYDELGITSLDELREAAEQQQIRAVKGLGPKAEENVLASLAKLGAEGPKERLLLSDVLPIAEELAAALREHPACDAVEVAGSARRRAETCKDIDLIATATDPKALAEALTEHELVATHGSAGAAGTKIVTHNGVSVDLRIVAPDAYGNLLQHFTGSAQHNIDLRERAVKQGLSVSEHGILETESGDVAKYATEAEVYKRLGLAYIEPELREGNGEIAAAADGRAAGRWSRSATSAATCTATPPSPTGATPSRRWPRRRRSAATPTWRSPTTRPATASATTSRRRRSRRGSTRSRPGTPQNKGRFKLLAGSEVNIGTDGSLDYDDELLERLDWVVASVHTSFRISAKKMTERVHHRDREPAGRLHRPPHRAADRQARALRHRRRGGRRGRRAEQDLHRDQRQPQPPRPQRGPRPARRRGRRADLRQHRRPRRRHPGQHPVQHRHRPPRLADQGRRRQHPHLGADAEARGRVGTRQSERAPLDLRPTRAELVR